MDDVRYSIYLKLNRLMDEELEKENPDLGLVDECVDGILRLMPESSYQITARQREESIRSIREGLPKRRINSKLGRVLLAAAIIIVLLICSVFAYTIVEYKIHDYGTYSEVWANITSKKIDEPVVAGYIPDGFELIYSDEKKFCSVKTYFNGDVYITIDKTTNNSSSVNTEFDNIRTVRVDEIDYLLFGEEINGKGVIWSNNNYVYSISAPLEEKELLKIAKTVR